MADPLAGELLTARLLESRGSYTVVQGGTTTLADFTTSASLADWLTGLSVAVPAAAQDGTATADLIFQANPYCINAQSSWSFRVVVESTNGITSGPWQGPSSATVAVSVPHLGFAVPAQTSIAVKVQAQRTASTGSGALRFRAADLSTYSLTTVFHWS